MRKKQFNETLNGIASGIPKHDVIVIKGDMTAKEGIDNLRVDDATRKKCLRCEKDSYTFAQKTI